MNGQAPEQQARGTRFGIIAGGGAMPFAVADALAARGVTPVIFALKGFCDPVAAARYEHYWTPVGKLGTLFRLIRQAGCRDLTFIGTLVRPALTEIGLDFGTLRLMPKVLRAFRGGDDHLLTGIGRLFEDEGFRLLGVKDVAPDILMPSGAMTRAVPDSEATADIARGRAVLTALSPFDIGQACVVIDGHVVGIEDIGGTDALLARVAELRDAGRIRAKAGRGVLVKAPKSSQDLRYDLPTTGPRTVDGAVAARLGGIAIVAGHTIVAEPQVMIATADAHGLFITGLPS